MAASVYQKFGKRAADVLLTVPAIIMLAPLLMVIALLVRVRLGKPVLFVQPRPGRDGRSFQLMKFRTMTDDRGTDGELLADEQRMTPFGRFLRSSSLDELPELWNVLRGDMSLVGPRPLLERYLPLYSPEQSRRHTVRPGITGWAQVNGRNRAGWEDRFAMDVWYVDHVTLWLDVRILLMTAVKVLRRDDINADGCATMTAFTGSPERRAA